MCSLEDTKGHCFKIKEKKYDYEKENRSGIAMCCITADNII